MASKGVETGEGKGLSFSIQRRFASTYANPVNLVCMVCATVFKSRRDWSNRRLSKMRRQALCESRLPIMSREVAAANDTGRQTMCIQGCKSEEYNAQ